MNRYIVPIGFTAAALFSFGVWWFLPALGEFGKQVQQGGNL